MAKLSGNTVSMAVWSEASILHSLCTTGFSKALPSIGVCLGLPTFRGLGFLHMLPLWNAMLSPATAVRASDRRQRGLLLVVRLHLLHCQLFSPVKIKTTWVKSWKWCFFGTWLKIRNPSNIDGNSYFFHHGHWFWQPETDFCGFKWILNSYSLG